MINEIREDYLWSTMFKDIDNHKLYNTCINVEKEIIKHFGDPGDTPYGSATTFYYKEYNLFHFPCTELHKLYCNLSKFMPKIANTTQWYIRCWVNLFAKDNRIAWHEHWDERDNTYHGFYCVNTEGEHPSHTEYFFTKDASQIIVPSLDSKCVIGKSQYDKHRTSKWLNEGYRTTIAFDIIPIETLRPSDNFSHKLMHNFIPLR